MYRDAPVLSASFRVIERVPSQGEYGRCDGSPGRKAPRRWSGGEHIHGPQRYRALFFVNAPLHIIDRVPSNGVTTDMEDDLAIRFRAVGRGGGTSEIPTETGFRSSSTPRFTLLFVFHHGEYDRREGHLAR